MPDNHGSHGNSSRQIQCRLFRNTPKRHFLPNSSGVATGRFRPRKCCWGEAGWKIDAIKSSLVYILWSSKVCSVSFMVRYFVYSSCCCCCCGGGGGGGGVLVLPNNSTQPKQRQETPSRTQRIFLGITTASLRQLRAGSVWSSGWSLGVQGFKSRPALWEINGSCLALKKY